MSDLCKTAVLAGLLALALTACSNGENKESGMSGTASEAPAASEPVSEPEAEPQEPGDGDEEKAAAMTASDSHVRMGLELDRDDYSHDTLIRTTLRIENIGEETLAYQMGSSSNIAPEALEYSLGGLTPLFRPEIMTMDYRLELLEPGQVLEFALDFAPYLPVNEDTVVGTERDIDFFQSEDFTPAQAGSVDGRAVFAYRVVPGEAGADDLMATFDELPPETLALDYSINIAE